MRLPICSLVCGIFEMSWYFFVSHFQQLVPILARDLIGLLVVWGGMFYTNLLEDFCFWGVVGDQ